MFVHMATKPDSVRNRFSISADYQCRNILCCDCLIKIDLCLIKIIIGTCSSGVSIDRGNHHHHHMHFVAPKNLIRHNYMCLEFTDMLQFYLNIWCNIIYTMPIKLLVFVWCDCIVYKWRNCRGYKRRNCSHQPSCTDN